MNIKLLGLISILNAKGYEMDISETVTFFNDMCFLAPATLIDRNIEWEIVDSTNIKATFKNNNISISAILQFNEKGELTNFISNDRFETIDGKIFNKYTWKTPIIGGYREIDGIKVPVSVQAIYERPEGDFCYGEFEIIKVEYNCDKLK